MKPHLVVENGSQRGLRVDLVEGSEVIVGRGDDADVTVDDHLASRRHFVVRFAEGRSVVEDLGSSNGTFVNDARIPASRELAHGDTLRAGETQFTYLVDEGSQSRGLVGKTIGGYRILERIGRGGMGTVYKALQVSLNRVVAFKILSPRVASDPTFVDKFHKEAQAAGRLNHPNIVQVYDVGSDKDLHYYSMEYIENGSVQDLATREGALEIGLALDIVLDAARGLEYAEKRGLVHRDIKPDNLMINAEGVVKIADLGLARDGGRAARESGASHSDDEGIFGTPHFIAPEQALGKAVDTRSDIYSLGASFYRILAGETPFKGDSVREIIQAQIHEEPAPLREKRRDVPTAVAALVERMMRKDMDERPATATELVTELERIQTQVEGGGRRRLLLAGAGLLIVGLVSTAAILMNDEEAQPNPEPKPGAGGPDTPEKTPEQLEEERLERLRLEAQGALSDARLEELGTPPTSEEELAAWIARYRELQEEYADVAEATAGADEWIAALERRLEAKRKAARAAAEAAARAREAAEAAVAEALAAIEESVKGERYGRAVATLLAAREQPALEDREEAAALDEKIEDLLTAARTLAETALAEGSAAEGNQDYARAIRAYDAAADKLRFEDTRELPALERVRGLIERLGAAASAAEEARLEKIVADHEADQALFLERRKKLLRTMRNGFDPARAREPMAAALTEFRTETFREMAREDLAVLDRTASLLESFLERSKLEGFDPTKIDLPSASGADRDVTWNLIDADSEAFTVQRGRFERRIPYADFHPAELWDRLLADRLPDDEATRRAAVRMFLMSGRADRAGPLAEPLDDAALEARIARERQAEERLARIRELESRAAEDPMVSLKLLPLIDTFLTEAPGTYAFSLATDGSTRLWRLDEVARNDENASR